MFFFNHFGEYLHVCGPVAEAWVVVHHGSTMVVMARWRMPGAPTQPIQGQ